MKVLSLSLENFRNFQNETVEFSGGTNVICGENAQGKTNLLESVYMLCLGRSFRTRFDRELISFDSDHARICAHIEAEERAQRVEILLRRGLKKQITKNGAKKTASELGGTLKTVLFSPDDLGIIKEGASQRRRLMDAAICQLRPGYGKLLSDYARVYENKLRILKDHQQDAAYMSTLEDHSVTLAMLSARLIRYRASFAAKLSPIAGEIHRDFSGKGEELQIKYKTVSTVTDPTAPAEKIFEEIMAHQKSHYSAELSSAQCLTGCHKDDLEIYINGSAARSFASQGQTRTAALSLKLAERELFLQDTGEYPILLLDDVLSELDAKRQEFVLNRIGGGQTLITCCEDDDISHRTGGRVIKVSGGRIV